MNDAGDGVTGNNVDRTEATEVRMGRSKREGPVGLPLTGCQ